MGNLFPEPEPFIRHNVYSYPPLNTPTPPTPSPGPQPNSTGSSGSSSGDTPNIPATGAANSDNTETPTTDAGGGTTDLKSLTQPRGRRSTILTSYRGVLSPNDLIPQRKSLLGE